MDARSFSNPRFPSAVAGSPGAGRGVRWSCRRGGTQGTAHAGAGWILQKKAFVSLQAKKKKKKKRKSPATLAVSYVAGCGGQNMERLFQMLSDFSPRSNSHPPLTNRGTRHQESGAEKCFRGRTC